MTRATPREVLRAFAEGRASRDAVMRALLEHDGWLAPVDVLGETTHNALPGAAIVYHPAWAYPDGELWLFTDREAADRAAAAGAPLGIYADAVPAARLFARLPAGIKKIKINNFGPREEFWFIGTEAFATAAQWLDAVAVERAVMNGPAVADDDDDVARLARFTWLLYLSGANHGVVGLPEVAGFQSAGVLFTAPDARDRFLAAVPPDVRRTLRRAWGDGAMVFRHLLTQGFDGVVVNPAGPSLPRAMPISVVQAVATAHPPDAASRIQIAKDLESA